MTCKFDSRLKAMMLPRAMEKATELLKADKFAELKQLSGDVLTMLKGSSCSCINYARGKFATVYSVACLELLAKQMDETMDGAIMTPALKELKTFLISVGADVPEEYAGVFAFSETMDALPDGSIGNVAPALDALFRTGGLNRASVAEA